MEFTELQLNRLKIVKGMLYKSTTKEEICQRLDINERAARELISTVAKYYIVISTSDQKGYRIADTESLKDLEVINHQFKENSKRADEVLERNDPIIKFYNKIGYVKENYGI